MPATTKKQERFMQAVKHNPKFAKEVGVPQKVGREFTKFADGGEVEKPRAGSLVRIDAEVEKATGNPKPVKEPPSGSLGRDMSDAEKKAWRDKKAKGPPASMFAKGGSIDGCAIRGKTKASHR